MRPEPRRPSPALDRLIVLAAGLRRLADNPALRRHALIAAAAVFAAGTYFSVRQLPEQTSPLQYEFLILIAAIGVPLMILANTVESLISARLVGTRFSWLGSLRLALISSAANMLPLPGGAIARISALKSAGAPLAKSSAATALIAAIWLGLAFCCAGVYQIEDHPPIAALFSALGVSVLATSGAALYRLCRSMRLLLLVAVLKSVGIAVGLLRVMWAFAALGVAVSWSEVSVFALSAVAGAAVAVVPAGLGVNEAVAALLAPLAGIASSFAFLAAALNRIVGLPVLFAITVLVSLVPARRKAGGGDERR